MQFVQSEVKQQYLIDEVGSKRKSVRILRILKRIFGWSIVLCVPSLIAFIFNAIHPGLFLVCAFLFSVGAVGWPVSAMGITLASRMHIADRVEDTLVIDEEQEVFYYEYRLETDTRYHLTYTLSFDAFDYIEIDECKIIFHGNMHRSDGQELKEFVIYDTYEPSLIDYLHQQTRWRVEEV